MFDKKAVKQTEETNLTAPDSRSQSQVKNRLRGLRGVASSDQKDQVNHFERDLANSNSIQNLSQEQYLDLYEHEEQRNAQFAVDDSNPQLQLVSSKLLSSLPPKEPVLYHRLESEKSQAYMDEIEEDQIEKTLIFTTHHVSEDDAHQRISKRIQEYQKSQLKYAKKRMTPQKYQEMKQALERRAHLAPKARCNFKEGQQILR